MWYGKYLYGEILLSPESGSIITYLPIIQRRKIERASPIAVIRVRLSDLGHGDIFSSKLLSTYQVLRRGLCDIHTKVQRLPQTRIHRLCNPVHPQWQQLLAP